jgi:hypothetical protein
MANRGLHPPLPPNRKRPLARSRLGHETTCRFAQTVENTWDTVKGVEWRAVLELPRFHARCVLPSSVHRILMTTPIVSPSEGR